MKEQWRWRKLWPFGNKGRKGGKKVKKAPPHPRSKRSLPPETLRKVWRGLAWGGGVAAILLLSLGGGTLFRSYFRENSQFNLQDCSDVVITTGSAVRPDTIRAIFGIKKDKNLFQVDIDEGRRKLLQNSNIKDIFVYRTLPGRLSIHVTEREPVARIKAAGWVVDEEGVVFIRYVGTGALPLIKLSDDFAKIKEGDRLTGLPMAAVRLQIDTSLHDYGMKIIQIDAGHPDYLLLTFNDLRTARFAWTGMLKPSPESEARMQDYFRQLTQAMCSSIGIPRQRWDATQPGDRDPSRQARVFALP